MAAATEHLGFGITVSSTYELPYQFARSMTTLDHLTDGRIGWNVVTSALDSAARNLGLTEQLRVDDRYEIADEFMEVVYQLWEGSWEDDAVVLDRSRGVYADPTKVPDRATAVDSSTCPASSCPNPRSSAPGHLPSGHLAVGPRVRRSARGVRVHERTADRHPPAVGRRPPSSGPSTGSRSPVDQGRRDHDGGDCAHGCGGAGQVRRLPELREPRGQPGPAQRHHPDRHVAYDLDAPLEYEDSPGIRSILANFTDADATRTWTPREIAEFMSVSSFGPVVVGGPRRVVDELERWVDEAGIDGFNIADVMPPASFTDFVELIVPELQRRARVWTEYEGSTLREGLLGTGQRRVRHDHPASRWTLPTVAPHGRRGAARTPGRSGAGRRGRQGESRRPRCGRRRLRRGAPSRRSPARLVARPLGPERPGDGQIASPDRLAPILGEVGIDDGTTVVAYDDGSGMYTAARLAWCFCRWDIERCTCSTAACPRGSLLAGRSRRTPPSSGRQQRPS